MYYQIKICKPVNGTWGVIGQEDLARSDIKVKSFHLTFEGHEVLIIVTSQL